LAKALAGDSLGNSARRALVDLATDSSTRVRINAVRSLAGYGRASRAELLAALRDPDAGVRLAAAQSLGPAMDSSSAAWTEAFDGDRSLVVQSAVAEGAAGQGISLAPTRSWGSSADWRYRAAAVGLDAHGAATGAARRLAGWMADRDARVRTAAAGALASLGDSATAREQVRSSLRAALRDRDVDVRAAALGGLANGASTEDLALALESYPLARRDGDADARLAFWTLTDSAIARVGDSLPDGLRARLSALPRPTNPLERIAASRLARFAGWRDSAGTPQPLAWYEARVSEYRSRPAPVARIETDRGTMELVLFAADAPLTVHNFVTLARRGYFDGQRFHRVVPNFVVQGGDPRGDGNGGPGYAIRDEIDRHRYLRGTLGMALSGPNTGGSQFFVTHSPQPHLDGGYTVFGQLRSGGSVLDRIVQGDRIVRITIR
ncbi:MAG: peptidylprolyl isomerase, partial [Gemmatimonadales bacterium]